MRYLSGFLLGISVCIFLGATTQINNRYDKQQQIYDEFINLYNTVQAKQFQIYMTTPAASILKEREIVIVSTGTVSFFTRIANSTYNITLEKK